MNAEVVVKQARLYEVAIPLNTPFAISGGTLRTRRSLIVELEDEDGNVGLGESAPFEKPFYSAETTRSAKQVLLDTLLPRVVGRTITSSSDLHETLTEGIVGNQMARAGCETAWWDLFSLREDLSLTELVGSRLEDLGVAAEFLERSSSIECGIALGIPEKCDVTLLKRWIIEAVDRGYRRIKLKVKPGWDEVPISTTKEILEDYELNIPITADANGAYDLLKDRDQLDRIDEMGLLYFEQPLPRDALWDLCSLSDELETPICLDETLDSELIARQVIDMGGPDVWNIKIQRVGGLEEACRIYSRAVDAGVRLWGGTMPETGLGALSMLALGCYSGFVYPSDIEPSDRWYLPGSDLVELDMSVEGRMEVRERREEVRRDGWKLIGEIKGA